MENYLQERASGELFEQVLCGIVVFETEGEYRIRQFNQACADTFGYHSKEEFMDGMGNTGILSFVYSFDKAIFHSFVERCLRTRQRVKFGHRILKKDRTIGYIIGSLYPVELEDGTQGIRSIFMDTSSWVLQADVKAKLLYHSADKHEKAKLILAEPDRERREELSKILRGSYEIVEVSSGQEVLSVLQKEREDIVAILADVEMLSRDQYRFLDTIKSNVIYSASPIVALLDKTQEDEENLLAYGVNEFFFYPYHPNIVKFRLANLVELRENAVQRNAIESIMDNIPGGILICKITRKIEILYASSGLLQLGGYTAGKMLPGDTIWEKYVYEKDRSRVQALLKSAVSQERRMEASFRLVDVKGELVWVHLHANKVRREGDGLVYQAVVSPTTQSEKMYRDVLDDSFDAVVVAALDNQELLYVNNEAAKLFERSEDAVEVFSASELPEEGFSEKKLILKNTSRHLTLHSRRMDWNGIPAQIVFATDDTERNQALTERYALYETEMSRRGNLGDTIIGTAIFNLSRNCLIELNTDRTFSEGMTEGMSLEGAARIIGMYIRNRASREAFMQLFSCTGILQAYSQGKHKDFIQLQYTSKKQEQVWITLRYSLIEHPVTGELLAFIYVRDVNEEVIRKEVYANVINQDMEYLLYLNVNSQRVSCLNAKKELRPLVKEESIPYSDFLESRVRKLFPNNNQEKLINALSIETMKKQLEKMSVYTCTYRVELDKEKTRLKRLRMSYVDENKELISISRTDITDEYDEQQKQNARLEKALSQAEQANVAKTMFFSRMSHDIRTPMNAILGISNLALDEVDDPESIRTDLKKIQSSGQYLLGLLNDILDMSKIESEEVELNPEPYTVRECIDFILVSMKPQMDRKNITFEYREEGGEGAPVLLDKMRFQQIFFNLISNAFKFTSEGGHIWVTLNQTRKETDRVLCRITVKDDGIGISKSAQQQIFNPFKQEIGTNQASEGSGLGLAIVKNLVGLMGGTITVESEQNSGASFIVMMEMKVAEDVRPAKSESKEEQMEEDYGGQKILLVEDQPINMEIARKLLMRKNIQVDMAVNGREACDRFAASEVGEYRLILMDIRMPEMDGLEAAREIRKMEREDAVIVPIVAMTANAFEEDVRASEQAGMNGHLAKPIVVSRLYQTVQKYLGKTGH